MNTSADAVITSARCDLLAIAQAALAAVHGRHCVAQQLRAQPLDGAVHLIAIGKAAAAMTLGACDVLGERIVHALVVTKTGHGDAKLARRANFLCMEAGHPLPDARSLAAGAALLDGIARAPRDAPLLFLISGGASSLVEVLPEGVTLDELRRANDWLIGSGLDIAALNAVRRALSRIKGGRLAGYLQGRVACALLISDVRGDDPAVIGSGLLVKDPRSRRIDDLALPDWLRTLCAHAAPEAAAPAAGVDVRIVARLRDALEAAARQAEALGYTVHRHDTFLSGDAVATGRQLARMLSAAPRGVHLWGGETTVVLPPHPGRGGRNQSLALAAALELDGRSDCALLALGSDGTDGPTEDAGALIDGGTVARGALDELDARQCLAAADAGTFLEASGDLIHTGPTGTNIMDLVIGLRL